MEKEFNIRHAFIIAFGTMDKCREIIDEIYSKNEQLYFEYYINSEFVFDLVKRTFSYKGESTINKLIGITQYCYDKKDYILIEKIIRKANPSINNFVKSSHIVDIDKYKDKYIINKINDISEQEMFCSYIGLMYLSSLKKKNFQGSEITVGFTYKYWDGYLNSLILSKEPDKTKFLNEDYTDKIAPYFKYLNLSSFENINIRLGLLLENFIEDEVNKKIYTVSNLKVNQDGIDMRTYEAIRSEAFFEADGRDNNPED